MATNYGDTVNAFYLAYYGRPADPAGLAFWTAAVEQNNGDFSTVISAFAGSPEATSRFGSDSANDRVSDIYQQLFGRAPDKAGLDYWVSEIEAGHLSVANAAIEIMHGAQKADEQTSTLRQEVAAQFTAEVKASGIAYDGVAAIEAARVLISAVNADSTPDDISNLIKAGASLVQTAHDNPAIITALAAGGDLSAVLNTASGKADPVGVMQALASIGKAALTDSAGLSALLQGGGMTGLLDSLPAGTSVKDVAAAVSNGGLSAGADVANPPPVETTPVETAPAAPTVALVADNGPSATDHITNNSAIKVSGLEAGSTWEFSVDNGSTWKPGAPVMADGTANLNLGATGAQTLLVHTTDASGNVSSATTFTYTAYNYLSGLLNVVGKYSSDVTTNSKGLTFNVTLSGHRDGVTTAYEVSSTGKADDFHAWDSSKALADGTYYFHATGSDLAGNAFTSNVVTVHLDNAAPPAPTGVQLKQDTGIAGDNITVDGHFVVSGLEQDALWQFSSDGTTWYAGSAAGDDGTATGFAQATGEQTLQVRTYDLAGNTSDTVSLGITVDNHNPADGLQLDHIGPDGVKGDSHTVLPQADVVYSYTGTINAGDKFEYTLDFETWTTIDNAMIDVEHKTITIHDLDMSSSDPYVSIHATSVAGANVIYQGQIDGPYTNFYALPAAAGPQVWGGQVAHLYLTDGSNPSVQVRSTDASGDLVAGETVTLGAQSAVVQGVLGAGTDALFQTPSDNYVYTLGTNGSDTLSGQRVWGFDGSDTLTGTVNGNSYLSGGLGEDLIHSENVSTILLYGSAQESFVVADETAAHGFDTVYTGTGGARNFKFEGLDFADGFKAASTASYTGNETGNALLALLNTTLSATFKADADAQAALVDAGNDVHFLVVDNGNGIVDATDYVIKLVGATQAPIIVNGYLIA